MSDRDAEIAASFVAPELPPKRTASEIGKANRRKGRRVEQDLARRMGGKRMVMSGGSNLGGGDLIFPADNIFSDWLWEVKARKVIPEIIHKALKQAEVEASGSRKKPAAIIVGDNKDPVVCFYLEDFIQWTQALAEVGNGSHLKALARDARRIIEEIEKRL